MKKSNESEELKNPEKSSELVDCRSAIKDNLNRKKPGPKHKCKWVGPPTDKERRQVYSYAAYGATDEDIAIIMEMTENLLRNHFRQELTSGRAIAKNTIAQKLYQMAVGRDAIIDQETGQTISREISPNLTSLIFLAKVRLGWKETQVVENKEVKSGVKIYLPDNGMKTNG